MREALLDAADDIAAMNDTFEPYAEFLRLEAQAEHVTHFNNSFMPGPLQNWVVAKTVLRARYPEVPDEQMDFMVDMRAERGKYYASGYVNATFFVTEAVLDVSPIDEKSWNIQLNHLINMANKPRTAVHIVPKDYFANGEDTMTLLDLPGGDRAVYFESEFRGDCLTRFTPAIEKVSRALKNIGSLALDEAASVELIRQHIKA
jgi:hypothetical protein